MSGRSPGLTGAAKVGRKAIGAIEKVSVFSILIGLHRSCIAFLTAAFRTRLERFVAARSHLAAVSSVLAK
jgi:hypothetical protein